jgi:GNAT superfamily N-acetyltransferase
VYVAAAARGQGIGTELTKTLAALARESGFHKMIGKLFVDNTASVPLCRALRLSARRRPPPPRPARRHLARRPRRRAAAAF